MTAIRRWNGTGWEESLVSPDILATTNTDQTITGIKTFTVAPVVPDGSFTIAKTTGLQTTLDSKYSASNPPPGGNVDLTNYVTLDGNQIITGNKVFQMSTIPGVAFVGGPAGTPGSIAAVSMARQGGTVDAWYGIPNTTKFFSDDQPGDFSVRANSATGAIRLGYGTSNANPALLVISSAGLTVNSAINATGNIYGAALATTGYSGPATYLAIQGTVTTRNVATFKLSSGATGDAVQVVNSANAVLTRIGPDGSVYAPALYDAGNRVYSASNPPPTTGGGSVDLSNYVTLNGAETLTGAKTFSALLTTTGIAATGTVGTPLISGYSSVISITPSTDAQDGLLIKVPTATYGTNVAYGEGQPIQVLTDGAGTGQSMVRFRVDRYGAIGTTGGLHISPGSNSSTYAPSQALWIQPLVNNVIPQITDGYGDVDIAWFRNAAILDANSAPKTLLKIKANGVTEISENLQSGTAYPGIQQVTVGSVFGVAGVYLAGDVLAYRPAATPEFRVTHTIRSDNTIIGTNGIFDGSNRVYSAANPPPGTVGQTGKELGYVERTTGDTTTNNVLSDASLAANLIPGMSITLIGTGTPVEVEVFVPAAQHSAVNGRTFAMILVNGAQANGSYGGMSGSTAGLSSTIIAKRRIVLTAGVSYTFAVAKFISPSGTGTYSATATAPMYISVVQR